LSFLLFVKELERQLGRAPGFTSTVFYDAYFFIFRLLTSKDAAAVRAMKRPTICAVRHETLALSNTPIRFFLRGVLLFVHHSRLRA
jgi:hypothetical protein